jgi:hypothetical protein
MMWSCSACRAEDETGIAGRQEGSVWDCRVFFAPRHCQAINVQLEQEGMHQRRAQQRLVACAGEGGFQLSSALSTSSRPSHQAQGGRVVSIGSCLGLERNDDEQTRLAPALSGHQPWVNAQFDAIYGSRISWTRSRIDRLFPVVWDSCLQCRVTSAQCRSDVGRAAWKQGASPSGLPFW